MDRFRRIAPEPIGILDRSFPGFDIRVAHRDSPFCFGLAVKSIISIRKTKAECQAEYEWDTVVEAIKVVATNLSGKRRPRAKGAWCDGRPGAVEGISGQAWRKKTHQRRMQR
jgi:hypothetical protein